MVKKLKTQRGGENDRVEVKRGRVKILSLVNNFLNCYGF